MPVLVYALRNLLLITVSLFADRLLFYPRCESVFEIRQHLVRKAYFRPIDESCRGYDTRDRAVTLP
ncbi:MAG: hypothetical protein ACOY5B_00765 [Spirochaetota bacterium]